MTTVVSRLYDKVETANRVADMLRAEGFPESVLSIITKADAAEIAKAKVSKAAAESYAAAMKDGQAVFVCRAPFTPFGAARRAMAVADSEAWIDTGKGACNEHVSETPDLAVHLPGKVSNHHLVMTPASYVGSGWSNWRMSNIFGWPTLSPRRERKSSVMSGTHYMSRRFWPGRLLSNRPRKSSVMEGGGHMSTRFGNFPLLTERKDKLSILPDHPKFSERIGLKLLSDRR
jgi:hypothetical protein